MGGGRLTLREVRGGQGHGRTQQHASMPGDGVWVWGLGFGVWGLGFGVWGLEFGVWGLEFRVWGLVDEMLQIKSIKSVKSRACAHALGRLF